MRNIITSLIIPFMLSASGMFGTYAWYKRFENEQLGLSAQDQPIAYLHEGHNIIEKRPLKRLIWREIDKGTPLYRGDAVRTSSNSEGRVHLMATDTYIALEPDSLIVLEDSKGKLELNLINGSLFVDSKSSAKTHAANAPIIKAGNVKLTLGGNKDTQIALTKTEKGDASLAVAKGDVAIKAGNEEYTIQEGKAGTLNQEGFESQKVIDTISPKPNATVVLDASQQTLFTWHVLPAEYKVHVAIGISRHDLAKVGGDVAGNTGKMSARIPNQPFYWQLVASDPKGKKLESLVLRANPLTLSAPEPLTPMEKTSLVLKDDVVAINFSWIKPQVARAVTLQLASTKDFSKVIYNKKLASINEQPVSFRRPGTFFWRLVADWGTLGSPVVSKVQSFEIAKALELAPPTLTFPTTDRTITQLERVILQWQDVPKADIYEIEVTDATGKTLTASTPENSYQPVELEPGQYSWRVRAKSFSGIDSRWSEVRKFHAKKVAMIIWSHQPSEQLIFNTSQPSATLRWQDKNKEATKWRLRYSRDKQLLANAKWSVSKQKQATIFIEGEGFFYFEAEGIDDSDQVVSNSEVIKLKVTSTPVLEAPNFMDEAVTFRAKANGSLELVWQPVEGATGYMIQIEHSRTNKVLVFKPQSNNFVLTDLKPGEYELKIGTYNQRAKIGPLRRRTVIVPRQSDIQAPKIKKIKVK